MKQLFTIILSLLFSGHLLAQQVNRGPYLQAGGPHSVVVKWRTTSNTDSKVWIGTQPDQLNTVFNNSGSNYNHEVAVTGLQPDTKYFYAVGNNSGFLAGGDTEHYFITAPQVETVKPVKVWVLGDCGTGNNDQRRVRDAYYNYMGNQETDLILLLGDNAYPNGSDGEYQNAIFQNMYEDIINRSPMWSCPGNHDYHSVDYNNLTGPYYEIFTFPTNGELGGVASGTEAYYSFDYANIHFISLDSHAAGRDPGDPMLMWLEQDINATSQDWIIVIFHHPPYTKGSHDSDGESHHIDMRENVLPILEEAGVDLVLGGHSHNYERSYLLNGHYDYSYTFQSFMKKDAGDGKLDNDGAYAKNAEDGEGAVYIVTGSAGKSSGGSLNHPAMYYSSSELGSVSLEIFGDQLDLKFINDDGVMSDYFTLQKEGLPSGAVPSVMITSPQNDESFADSVSVMIQATAADSDGSVTKVEFFIDGSYLGTDYDAPYQFEWIDTQLGQHELTTKAYDDMGNTRMSEAVSVKITYSGPGEIIPVFCPEEVVLACDQANGSYVSYELPEFQSACALPVTECVDSPIPGMDLIGSFNDNKYYISNGKLDWDQAKTYCEEYGGHLAVISSYDENEFLSTNMNVENAWIGYSDHASEGQFEWVVDNTANFNNWGDWQPSNSGGNEHYVHLANDGKWYDKTNFEKYFILEIPCALNSGGTNNYSLDLVSGIESGGFFPEGNTIVSYAATNPCGQTAQCDFTITVETCPIPEPGDCQAQDIHGFEFLAEGAQSMYYLSKNELKWADAKIEAEAVGGHLVHIESESENQIIISAIESFQIVTLIGLTDAENEGIPVWSDGSPMQYDAWDISGNDNNYNYGTLNPWTGKWELVNEWVSKRFIIEIPCSVTANGMVSDENNYQAKNQILPSTGFAIHGRSIKLFPNPVKDTLTVKYELEFKDEDAVIQFFHTDGKLIKSIAQPIHSKEGQFDVAVADFVAGTYLMKLISKNGEVEAVFMKK